MLAREPDALAAHVRFDEGSVETGITARLFRHRQTKGAANRYAEPNVYRATLLLYRHLAECDGGLRFRMQSAPRSCYLNAAE